MAPQGCGIGTAIAQRSMFLFLDEDRKIVLTSFLPASITRLSHVSEGMSSALDIDFLGQVLCGVLVRHHTRCGYSGGSA